MRYIKTPNFSPLWEDALDRIGEDVRKKMTELVFGQTSVFSSKRGTTPFRHIAGTIQLPMKEDEAKEQHYDFRVTDFVKESDNGLLTFKVERGSE